MVQRIHFFACATQNRPIILRNSLIIIVRHLMANKSDKVRMISCHEMTILVMAVCTFLGSVEKSGGKGFTYLRGRTHVLARMVARTCGDGCTYLREKRQCTAGTDAVHCNRSRSALQPPLQCTASARTYLVYFKRKYMRPPRITFATADANVINRGCKRYKPLPQTFAGKGAHLGIPSPMVFQMCLEQVIDSHWNKFIKPMDGKITVWKRWKVWEDICWGIKVVEDPSQCLNGGTVLSFEEVSYLIVPS